jgi:O-antigen/teichoic acid export membrane protein
MSRLRRHATNAAALAFSGAWAKVFAFATTVMLLKTLPTAENSIFQLGLAIAAILAMVGELGVRGFALREIARVHDQPAEAQRLFSDFLAARLLGSVALFPLALLVLWAFSFSQVAVIFTMWLLLYAVLDAFAMFLKFVLRAYERMEFDAVFSVVGRGGVLLVLVWLATTGRLSLGSATLAHVAGAALEVGALFVATRRVTGLRFLGRFDLGGVRDALVKSLPFAVVNVVGLLYIRTGTLAVSKILGEDQVVFFAAASKIPESLSFMPVAIVNAVIPFLSRNYGNREVLDRYFTFILRYLGIAGAFIAAVLIAEPRWIIHVIATPEYLKSTAAFQWYGVYGLVTFFQYAIVNFLICINEEKSVMRRYAVALPMNIALNIALVPRFGITGAAMAIVITEVAALMYQALVLHRHKHSGLWRTLAGATALTAVGVLLMRAMPGLQPVARVSIAAAAFTAIAGILAWRADRDLVLRVLRRG